MRMDQRQTLTAADIVNDYDEMELFRIIRDYGEDKFAKNIAKHIVAARNEKRIETTFELNEIIKASIPAKCREKGGHPSKRTFQAIRIECNRELEVLRDTIDDMIDCLKPGGRLCIITFHSLEDRMVKQKFKSLSTVVVDKRIALRPEEIKEAPYVLINRKALVASPEELENNPRAKSAKLRGIRKVGNRIWQK